MRSKALKLVREDVQNVRVITEDINGGRNYFIEGVLMQANIPNRNGRMYPGETLFREVEKYITEKIDTKRSLGELGHPDSPNINLDRVSHLLTELNINGNDVVGRGKILDTPNGKIVKALIDEGVQLGVSTRGLGSLTKDGDINIVDDDFVLSAVDIVADPSAPDAFVQGIMEGKEWVYEGGVYRERFCTTARKRIAKAPARNLEALKLRLFEDFISKL